MRNSRDRSRDSEAVPETRGTPVDRQRQILIRHYNRTGLCQLIINGDDDGDGDDDDDI